MPEGLPRNRMPQVTFWPRPAARSSPVERDVLCENCGYNLRGLPPDISQCPECGTKFDPKLLRTRAAESLKSQLPWKQRRAVGFFEGYWGSVRMVLLHPQKFALEIWQGGKLTRKEADAFRWITIAHAWAALVVLGIATVGTKIPAERFVAVGLGAAAFLLLWLHKTTRLPVQFFEKQMMQADVQRRVIGLAHFTCAPLALMPIHIALLALFGGARKVEMTPTPGMLATTIGIVWVAFAVTQLLLWWSTSLRLVKAAMQCNEAEMAAVALIFLGVWTLQTGFYLVGAPWVLFMLVSRFFGW